MNVDEFNKDYIDILAKETGQDRDYVMNTLITLGIEACSKTGMKYVLENLETTNAN